MRKITLRVLIVSAMLMGSFISVQYLSRQSRAGADEQVLTFEHAKQTLSPLSTHQKYPEIKAHVNFNFERFYSTDLIKNPEHAYRLSPLLTTRMDVINEAQRIHMHIFGSILRGYKYAMLFDYSPSENKGDSAIVVGEITLLRKLNIEVIFACPTGTCIRKTLQKAVSVSEQYSEKDLVILFHGGGNVIGFHAEDTRRFAEIKQFMKFHIVMFPQSVLYRGPKDHIELCKRVYASHTRLTFVWRDRVSYATGAKLFPKVQSLLSPDIAYEIGHVTRFMLPTQDILWLRREDGETPGYSYPPAAEGYHMNVSDWLRWYTPRGTSPMEDSFLMTTNGLMFLQRGRIVITDRLHGHILSTLLDIPHVYIDNKQRKISNYHKTWTASVDNIVYANSSSDALVKAKDLLAKLDKHLPELAAVYTTFDSD